MGILDAGDEEEQNDNQSKDQDASVSYLYIYEEARDEVESWSADAQSTMQSAYEACSGGGTVRETFKNSAEYENIHHAAGVLMDGIRAIFEDQDFEPILDFLMGTDDEDAAELYAGELADWLRSNPQVHNALVQELQSSGSDEDEEEEAEAAPADD